MSRSALFGIWVAIGALFGIGVVWSAGQPFGDPADVTGAASEACFNCKDLGCGYCPDAHPCRVRDGYCIEVVRNTSQVCSPSRQGDWERCKTRYDDTGSCVVRLVNPCTPEAPVCATPVEKCGPLATCIPEGVCIP